jgi:hypothetical protein
MCAHVHMMSIAMLFTCAQVLSRLVGKGGCMCEI